MIGHQLEYFVRGPLKSDVALVHLLAEGFKLPETVLGVWFEMHAAVALELACLLFPFALFSLS